MIQVVPVEIVKHALYVWPVFQTVGIVLDVKEILETTTPMCAVKVVAERFVKKCTPSELIIAGKCRMFVGGIVVSVGLGGNPLIVGGTMSAKI
jgi:hypothetical protein